MDMHNWLLYLALVLAATATPGPAVLFAMTVAAQQGLRKSVFAALGNISGLFMLGAVAVTGLGVLLNTSELVFNLIKYVGALYLVYLGSKMILQKGINFSPLQGEFPSRGKSAVKIYLQASGVALSNPKALVFLTALLPQFISTEQPLLSQFILLITTLMFFSFCALIFYAWLASKAKYWLLKPARMKNFNRVSGGVFIGFGALLATAQR